ncbi:MAG: STAS domain-containing protein [Candidatus Sumerlaeota bacterium]|nr:STAS domain-containing protein [Candidatus Sumerlaeota bacterium]
MNLEIYCTPTTIYIKISGRIVLDECEVFKSAVYPLFQRKVSQIAIDLENAQFIDSAGLGALVGMKTRASQANARFVLVNPAQPIMEILNISKLSTIFQILTGLEATTLRVANARPENLLPPPGTGGAI